MDTFTVSFEYKKHDGSSMNFATNVNQPTFGVLLDSDVFETVPSLRMFKNQFQEDLSDRDIRVSNTGVGKGVGTIAHKKPRGRPPKSNSVAQKNTDKEVTVPKKRGRPPKNNLQSPSNSMKTSDKETPVKQTPVKQRTPVKQTPAKQTPAKQTPVKRTTPISSPEM